MSDAFRKKSNDFKVNHKFITLVSVCWNTKSQNTFFPLSSYILSQNYGKLINWMCTVRETNCDISSSLY